MKLVSCLPVALFLWIAPQEPAGPPQPQISALNFLRVEKDVCTAGQPSLEDLARLKQEGVRSLINLRRPQEDESGQATEKKTAEELGFKYFSIPVDSADIRPEQVEEFRAIVKDPANGPFFIHCRTAGRVGAFWMIHRVLDDGWSCDKAEQEARQIGLASPHLLAFAKSYILEKKPDACPQP
jgi:uncharacterized protein (TIGR01244 family)